VDDLLNFETLLSDRPSNSMLVEADQLSIVRRGEIADDTKRTACSMVKL